MNHTNSFHSSDEFSTNESREFVNWISETSLFQNYEEAFSKSSGIPLAIRPFKSSQIVIHGKSAKNKFCSILAKKSKSCAACLEIQSALEQSARTSPKSIHCFAEMCETMIPIRIDKKLIAFLQTGQVFLNQPTTDGFSRITRKLTELGAIVDLINLEEAYFQTPVFEPKQYAGFISIHTIFAQHLAAL